MHKRATSRSLPHRPYRLARKTTVQTNSTSAATALQQESWLQVSLFQAVVSKSRLQRTDIHTSPRGDDAHGGLKGPMQDIEKPNPVLVV
jgi:hypothetical protein